LLCLTSPFGFFHVVISPFLGVSRHVRAPFVPSFSLSRWITVYKSLFRTFIFPFSVDHGIQAPLFVPSFSLSRWITAYKPPFRTVIFPFPVDHDIQEPLSYCYFSLSRWITAYKSPFRTVIFPFSVDHGIQEPLSYRHFSFLGGSRLYSELFLPSSFLSQLFTATSDSFNVPFFLFQLFKTIPLF
jgi:hypothetical protein